MFVCRSPPSPHIHPSYEQAMLAYRPRHPDASLFFDMLTEYFVLEVLEFPPAAERGITIYELVLRPRGN